MDCMKHQTHDLIYFVLPDIYVTRYWFSFNSKFYFLNMSQFMRLWYLSHRWPAKAQASLHIQAVSPKPSLYAHMKYGIRQRVRPKFRQPHRIAAHARLKNELTEDGKYHKLMRWLIFWFVYSLVLENIEHLYLTGEYVTITKVTYHKQSKVIECFSLLKTWISLKKKMNPATINDIFCWLITYKIRAVPEKRTWWREAGETTLCFVPHHP